ncbi:type 4a pilus biogenesis protein PilO [Natranaerofaba carboxydovora]|uniref:type 4a pilus biogenesis protein PilO n=1 Tax=Natranaerofaba carboxydovora TaxID=2742683 RepID=UPI001F138BD3|nr:type 4a pilus biogenesis protein PilO [Natranaerofaba carboxydovora]UMZ73515.1 Pilus assembly protein, PilO [Natranaerofaba carboxydovora]
MNLNIDIKSIKLNKKARTILFIIAGFLLFLLLFYVTYMQFQSLADSREELAYEKENLSEEKSELAWLQELKENESLMKEQITVLQNALPESSEKSNIIRYIRGSIHSSGNILDINFESQVSNENYIEQPIHIVFEGRYEGLVSLINNLNTSPRAFRIDEIEIYSGSEGLPQIMADVYVSAFYLNK